MTAIGSFGFPVDREFVELRICDRSAFGAESDNCQALVWVKEGESAIRPNVPGDVGFRLETDANPLQLAHSAASGPNPVQNREWRVQYLNLRPGQYFRRIARPSHQHPADIAYPANPLEFLKERSEAVRHADALAAMLGSTFQTIDPDERNFPSFGREFRDILILAATEFEAQAKGILRANGYTAVDERRWSTNDYVKLEPALRLRDFGFVLVRYPWLPPVRPFDRWDRAQPSSSLDWYHNYNLVKHDREEHADKATLSRAIHAVAAIVAMGVAQFGYEFMREAHEVGRLIGIAHRPRWSIGDTVGMVGNNPLEPVPYPFD